MAPRESAPPGGLVEVLARWEEFGGRWEVLGTHGDWVEIGLLPCDGGGQVSRVSGAQTSVLQAFLAGRTSSDDDGPRDPDPA